ncbi:MAG TPA: RNA polymerase sigma factor [Candidatus Polarisedimenticolaceae bacterium]|nr:RNA polymerase sigma factor [Candidatus Polarisedimenticolaceae bacterium]
MERSGDATSDRSRAIVERTIREHWGYILATLVGYVRDLQLAEDVLQDAAVAALEHWPASGVPRHPCAWLLQTARRKAIDRFRRDRRFEGRKAELQRMLELEQRAAGETEETLVDERLSLIFTCCHPALGETARVALTLRTLGGLTTAEIARAFLVAEPTMHQRLVRAQAKIKTSGIPYRVPPPELWPERLDSVLAVIYLIFNEGYAARSGGEPTRTDLSDEAIRLGRIVVRLAPSEPEAVGLLALMLLHDSRREARTDAAGRLVPLSEQDRGSWNRGRIAEGERLLRRALAAGRAGPYRVQAAISACHATATSHETTDWHEITGLYAKLYELQPSWVVKLNQIVALSFAVGPEAGLRALAPLESVKILHGYQPFHAARADLLRRAGRSGEAATAYRRALELTTNAAERGFLERRLDGLGTAG